MTELQAEQPKPVRYTYKEYDLYLTGANAMLFKMCKVMFGEKAEAEYLKMMTSRTDEP